MLLVSGILALALRLVAARDAYPVLGTPVILTSTWCRSPTAYLAPHPHTGCTQ
jgi:hypothetical protein